jgi:malonate-semialdehyde dehydrogenase (acetylating)/methylmalonate-semialdehyde dehydrogenase
VNVITQGSNGNARTAKLLIDGEFVESRSAEWRDIVNPATQQLLGRVPFATADEVGAAIHAAHTAFLFDRNAPARRIRGERRR